MFYEQFIAGFQLVKRAGLTFPIPLYQSRYREIGFVVSVKSDEEKGILLKPFSDKQKEYKPGQAIQIPLSRSGEYIKHAAEKQSKHAHSNGDVDADLLRFHCPPG